MSERLSNVFEEAFMKMAVKMVETTLTTETLANCAIGLIGSVKKNIDQNDFCPDDNIGPLITYGDLADLGPFWYNSKQVQSEMVTLIVGMLIGDLMSEYIQPSDMTLSNVFKLTTAVDANAKAAQLIVEHMLIEKFGPGLPDNDFKLTNIESKLLGLLDDVLGTTPDGEPVPVLASQLVDVLDQVADVLEQRRASATEGVDEKKGKTLH